MVSVPRSLSFETVSRLFSALAILSASSAAGLLLFPAPLADAFFAGWVVGSVGISLVGGIGAWTNRTPLVWVAALFLTGLSIVGMWSIGLFIAPAALFLLCSAVFSQLAGPREGVREAIISDPPPVRETALKALAGVGSVAVGGWLVYAGSIERHLFGACLAETLTCVVEKTHWDAVGVTVLGLIAVGLGGWVIWKQIYVARVLASKSRTT